MSRLQSPNGSRVRSLRSRFRAFGPRSIIGGTDLQFFLEADTITDHNDAEGIVSGDFANPEWPGGDWRDQSGSNNHPYSDTVTNEPLWFGTIVNTLPGARYDGVNDYSQSIDPVYDGAGDMTIWMVVNPRDAGVDGQWAGAGDFLDGAFQVIDNRQDASNGKLWLAYHTAGDIAESEKQVGTFPYETPLMVQMKVAGQNVKGWINGVEVIDFTLAGAKGAGARNLFLGHATGEVVIGNCAKIDLAAVLFFNVATSAEVDTYWNNYLTTKYGPFA